MKTVENITLNNDTVATVEARMAYDGFYGEVLMPEEDGGGQKIMKLVVSVDGNSVAGAEAGYLDERRGGILSVLNIKVDEAWRRMGVATAIYNFIETQYGDRILPYPGNEGGAIQQFWYDRLKAEPDVLKAVEKDIGALSMVRCSSFEI